MRVRVSLPHLRAGDAVHVQCMCMIYMLCSACAVHAQCMCNGRSVLHTEPTTLCAGHDRGGALCGAGQQAAAVPVGPGPARTWDLTPAGPTDKHIYPEVLGCHLSSQYKVKVINNTFILRSRGRLTAHARSSITISNGIKLYDVVEIRGQSIFYKVKI